MVITTIQSTCEKSAIIRLIAEVRYSVVGTNHDYVSRTCNRSNLLRIPQARVFFWVLSDSDSAVTLDNALCRRVAG